MEIRRSIALNWIANITGLLLVCPLVFGIWYSYPMRSVLEMGRVIGIFFAVQAIIAATLPLLLIRRGKTDKAIFVDWLLVIAVQVLIFFAGVHVLYSGRPAAIVFEQDRFVVVPANKVLWSSKADEFGNGWGKFFIPRLVGVDLSNSKEGVIKLLAQSLQGIEPNQREDLWVPYAVVVDRVRSISRSVSDIDREERDRYFLKNMRLDGHGVILAREAKYLPFTSFKNKNWIVVLNDAGYPMVFLPIDGFR